MQKAGKNPERLSLGRGNLEKKPHLVKWATVCTDKKVGGLRVRDLHKLNKALLGKWL